MSPPAVIPPRSHTTGLAYGATRSPPDPIQDPINAPGIVEADMLMLSMSFHNGERTLNCASIISVPLTCVGVMNVMSGGKATILSDEFPAVS